MPRTRGGHPLSYEEDAARLKVTSQRDLGLHPIPVNRIVGSAGKPEMVDANFKPLLGGWAAKRFSGLVNAAKQGTPFQPISVNKLHDLYYVVDGHNRVGAAKELGQIWIDAYVTEALPRAEGMENLLYYERKRFEEATGLTRIHFSALGLYPRLLAWIQAYTVAAYQQLDKDLTVLDGAQLWYREVYRPMAARINQHGLKRRFPDETSGDVFVRVWDTQVHMSHARKKPATLYEAFFELERRHPAPLPARVLRRSLEAVTNPLPIPPRPPQPDDDPATAPVELPRN